MKKNYFLLALAAAGMMSLASCSNNDDGLVNPEEKMDGEQVIMLDMQDTDVLSSRSRPLYSTENMGAEKVTDVKLFVFKHGVGAEKTFVKAFHIENWNSSSSDYDYGRKYTYSIPTAQKLEAGTYTIVAVGQDETTTTVSPYTWGSGATKLPALTLAADASWSSTVLGASTAGLIPDAATVPAEIFSGQSAEVTVASNGAPFSASVLLKRQVAGVLGYFTRIPAEVLGTPVTNIRLVAVQKNTKLDLLFNLAVQEDDDTEENSGDSEKVVNGFEAELGTTHEIYNIDLKEWFSWDNVNSKWNDVSIITQANGMKLLAVNEGSVSSAWQNGIGDAVSVAEGSVLAGSFMIPISKVTDNDTFQLQLLSESGAVLHSWRVKLDAGSIAGEDAAYVYNIYRNHLYQIGKRGEGDKPGNPGENGDDGDEDDDKPQPLDNIQELVIKINDHWEFIHDMELE